MFCTYFDYFDASKPNVGVNVLKYKTKNGDKTKATWDYQLGI